MKVNEFFYNEKKIFTIFLQTKNVTSNLVSRIGLKCKSSDNEIWQISMLKQAFM